MFFHIILLVILVSLQNLLGMDVPKNPLVALTEKQFESVAQYIRKDWDSFVKRKLDSGIPVNGCNENGETFLHHAVMGGHHDVTKLLLSRKASVHSVDKNFYTPLHSAITSNEHAPSIVLQLLACDASVVSLSGFRRNTSLFLAAESGMVNLVKIILVKARHHIDYTLGPSDVIEEAIKLMTDFRIMEGKKLLRIQNKERETPLSCVQRNLQVLSLRNDLSERDVLLKAHFATLILLLSENMFEDNYRALIEQDVRKILQTQQKKQ